MLDTPPTQNDSLPGDDRSTMVMPAVSGPAPKRRGSEPKQRRSGRVSAGGGDGLYRRWRRSLHHALRSGGAWSLAAVVGVLSASVPPLTTVAGGIGTGAGTGVSWSGSGVQAVAAAGPDTALLDAVAGSRFPWLLFAVPVVMWLARVAVKG